MAHAKALAPVLQACDCLNRCGDDPAIYALQAQPCSQFIEQARRESNARLARVMLTELGYIEQYDGAALVAALTELKLAREQLKNVARD